MQKIDELDLKILSRLQDDARQSYIDLARDFGVTEGTIYNRIIRMKELGVIRRFVLDIDFHKLGYTVNVLVGIVVDSNLVSSVEHKVEAEPNINAVYSVTGEYNLILAGMFREKEELDVFIKKLSSIYGVHRVYPIAVTDVIKEDYGIDLSAVKL